MGENSAIGWTDSTFNPWVGCEKVSPGCAYCYAESLVTGRMGRAGTWGAAGTRERTAASTWAKPLAWERGADRWHAEHGRRQRVFCASLADMFEPRPELEPWRAELFDLIEACPSLDWLLLTKRPEEARDWLAERLARICSACGGDGCAACDGRGAWGELPPNVWVGVSIENSRYTWRADVLREIPAAVRFISAEPLLGSLFPGFPKRGARYDLDLSGIDWLIVGGESGGRSARPMHPQWARELRAACLGGINVDSDHPATYRPAFFFKQWGSWAPDTGDRGRSIVALSPDGSVRSAAEALPSPDTAWMRYAGAAPTSGGHLLDGHEWSEFPEPTRVAA